jgi:isopenicillin N synthase-like dioxygenase
MHLYSPPKAVTSIPVIDIGPSFSGDDAAFNAVASAIHRACRETGFFYVSNHGVPASLIEKQFVQSKAFFALPLTEKMALDLKNSPSAVGYSPIKGQKLDSQDANAEASPGDLKESFVCGPDFPDDHPYVRARYRSYGHNQWPQALPELRDQSLAYLLAMRSLADHILTLLAASLELPTDWFAPHFAQGVNSLRMLKYPPQPEVSESNQLGAGAHTDWGGVTLLAQDGIGGLEVRNVDGDWIVATPIAGTLVVNLGDLMARWTNGIYNSTMHRVKNNATDRDRYSIATFYGPDPLAVIEPIPTCLDADHPRRFETCTADEHMSEMFRRSYGFAPGAAQTAA